MVARSGIALRLVVALVATAGAAWCYRAEFGRSVTTRFPLKSATVYDTGLGLQRAAGSKVDDVLEISSFGRFRPVRSLQEALATYGPPDGKRFAKNRTTLEYSLGHLGRIEFVEELVVSGPAYSLRAFPVHASATEVLRGVVLELAIQHLDPTADQSGIVIEDPNGEIEILVTLRGLRVEEISWSTRRNDVP